VTAALKAAPDPGAAQAAISAAPKFRGYFATKGSYWAAFHDASKRLETALAAVPAGRLADRFGSQTITVVGLIVMAIGSIVLAIVPASLGIAGFIAPIVVITGGYSLFQTANNTAVMTNIRRDQRGVISGMLNLSRNLGRLTGASVMGAVFSIASATTNITTARPDAVATGMRITFAAAAVLIVVALAIAVGSRAFAQLSPHSEDVS